ncbi:multicopper oxidase-domain-containing protein [Microdochium trichocladiopsis]|uniref:Multicopper oxidase-domain-containing protein n=1 Tax=Microdochium trichocladiopsis TaxID=1682393 RepID=A0A9P8YKI6_9PEZI|nr:multicopper oxidase-domain-containing protein [Microdochium trichocladiopsis]KAH7041161.1 multicopper oxidase-domain-containing protein [Microdochium trichocladiopsis]
MVEPRLRAMAREHPFDTSAHCHTRQATEGPCENSPTSRQCWGQHSINTDWYEVVPETGATREYWLNAELIKLAPDGYEVAVLALNGSMPGPLIEADWGDEVVVHVTNNIETNGTAIHWHGIHQRNTNAHDGVPGVTQCPTAPGKTTTYRFRATQYGTSWYHSHFSLQLAMVLGPLVIHGPATANYDVDLGPLVLMDWFHGSVFHIWETTQRVVALHQPNQCARSTDPRCKGTGERFEFDQPFEPGKKYLIRLIGSQTDGYFKPAIDGHKLPGQRYDVIVEAKPTTANSRGRYWMRAIYQTACNFNDNDSKGNILGIVRYAGADTSPAAVPTTAKARTITNSCEDEPYESLTPWLQHDVGPAKVSDRLRVAWYYELDLVYHWTINTKTLIVNWSDPTVLDVHRAGAGQQQPPLPLKFPRNSNVWVIEDRTLVNVWYPMHLHGHDFYVLAQGRGPFVPGLVRLNTKNPPRRDTVSLYGTGYTVITFKTDNPGAWLMHCHIAWHASQGLSLQLLARAGELSQQIGGDAVQLAAMDDTCADWKAWYPTSPYHQDNSGI